jgi:hypothetical protein
MIGMNDTADADIDPSSFNELPIATFPQEAVIGATDKVPSVKTVHTPSTADAREVSFIDVKVGLVLTSSVMLPVVFVIVILSDEPAVNEVEINVLSEFVVTSSLAVRPVSIMLLAVRVVNVGEDTVEIAIEPGPLFMSIFVEAVKLATETPVVLFPIISSPFSIASDIKFYLNL